MANSSTTLATPYEEMPQQREAATLGMWTFLATEILFFGAMFMAYTVYRTTFPEAFAIASHHTIVMYGTINTAILLTSSFTMALAVHAAKEGNNKIVVRLLGLTVMLAVGFIVVKGLEYSDDLKENLWPGTNFRPGLPAESQIFWVLYWIMTGVHAVHVTVGIFVISYVARMAAKRKFSTEYYTPVEMTGLYWHFVDIIWIFLYPLLYLVNRYSA
jgi:cytochrome c oxidase subunit III